LPRIEIGAAGIVATGVNQDDVAFAGPLEVLEHGRETQAVCRDIVVGVALEPQP